MGQEMKKHENNGDFERRAQSVVQVIITLLVGWIGFSLVDMGKSIVVLQVQGAQASAMIVEMKADVASVKVQASTAALAANTAATAATTAAALAATAATTAAALAAQSHQKTK
jgi:cell division protein FtsB